MNLKENVFEAISSIRANLLRTILTSAIIMLGITSLVGILTAIEGMQGTVNKSFEGIGANSFDIKIEQNNGRRRQGVMKKPPKPISYKQALGFKNKFGIKNEAKACIYTFAGQDETIKYDLIKTNPNIILVGIDENYLDLKAYKLISGRNISKIDNDLRTKVVVLGKEVAEKLFGANNPMDKFILIKNEKYKIIGVLDKKGSITGGGDDRVCLIPLETSRNYDTKGLFSYEISTSVPNVKNLEKLIGEATSIFRIIRQDKIGEKDSFKIESSDALMKDFNEVTGFLRIGGFGISFITLLGASIALMNIMMVSVTERTREIGIRKALGASPSKIRLQFLIEAIVICILGGLAGVILGLLVGNLVSQFLSKGGSFVAPWNWISLGLSVCILVGLISGYYPAYRASKFDPIESLRYE